MLSHMTKYQVVVGNQRALGALMAVTARPQETARLRAVMENPHRRLRFTRHAREEMANDEIIEADVSRVLRLGQVCWLEFKADELWHVEGKDVDERSIRLVVAVHDDEVVVKIITAMTLRQ